MIFYIKTRKKTPEISGINNYFCWYFKIVSSSYGPIIYFWGLKNNAGGNIEKDVAVEDFKTNRNERWKRDKIINVIKGQMGGWKDNIFLRWGSTEKRNCFLIHFFGIKDMKDQKKKKIRHLIMIIMFNWDAIL